MPRLHRLIAVVSLSAALGTIPAVTEAAGPATYVVQPGDFLIGIASKNGVSLPALLDANDLTLSSVIHPGQRLAIPGGSAATQSGSSTQQAASSYTVKWGDTLIGIAGRHRVSLSSLLAANQMTSGSLIMPGMQLKLPAGASSPAAPTSTTTAPTTPAPTSPPAAGSLTHTIKWGDTLSGIAGSYNVSLSSLLAANNMTSTSLIMPGMQLQLPAGSTAPAAAPTPAPSAGPAPGPQPNNLTGVAKVLSYVLAQEGKPYKFFTAGPDTFDCSGLTRAAYAQIGVSLIHHSATQAIQGTSVDFLNEPIKPGDLVFLSTHGSSTINHVGIAINSTTWIHATSPGNPVKVGWIPSKSAITVVRRYVQP